jgi:hypothetical protein
MLHAGSRVIMSVLEPVVKEIVESMKIRLWTQRDVIDPPEL